MTHLGIGQALLSHVLVSTVLKVLKWLLQKNLFVLSPLVQVIIALSLLLHLGEPIVYFFSKKAVQKVEDLILNQPFIILWAFMHLL